MKSVMDAGRFRILSTHFLRGYVENDALAPDAPLGPTLAPMLAAIAAPGVLLPMMWSVSYGWPFRRAAEYQALAVRHEVLLVLLPMVVVALVTVLRWDSLYPDRRDAEILGRLPVPPALVFAAKATALTLFVGLFAVAANGLPSVLYPVVANLRPQPGSQGWLATFVAHLAATFGATAFAAFGVLAVLGVLQAVLPHAILRVVSPVVQLGAVLVLVLAFLMLPFLMMAVDPHGQGRLSELVALHRLYADEGGAPFDWNDIPAGSRFEPDPVHGGMRPRVGGDDVHAERAVEAFPGEPVRNALTVPPAERPSAGAWLFWCPPVWFLGVYEELAGRGGASTRLLASRAWSALGLAVLLTAVSYGLAYRRHTAGAILGASAGGARTWRKRVARIVDTAGRLAVPDAEARAYFVFTIRTVTRSGTHRLIAAASLGAALAFVLAEAAVGLAISQEGRPSPQVLSIQFVLMSFLVAGLRFAFAVPAGLQANWTFRIAAADAADACRTGARRALVGLGVIPILAGLLPIHAALYGWDVALRHAVLGLTGGLALVEAVTAGFPKVPFASPYVPGRARLRSRLTLYVFGFQFFAYVWSAIESLIIGRDAAFAGMAGFALLVYAWLVRARRARAAGESLVYDEDPPDAIQTLGISGPLPRPDGRGADASAG